MKLLGRDCTDAGDHPKQKKSKEKLEKHVHQVTSLYFEIMIVSLKMIPI